VNAQREDIAIALHRGIECCRKEEWDQGLHYLGQIAQSGERSGLPGLFYSYLGYGIARCQRRIEEGRKLCEHAIKVEFYQPENYLNLARTCLLTSDRDAAVRAIRRGLKIDPHSLELLALQRQVGLRGAPVLPFLSRSNLVNRILGRIRHVMRGQPGEAKSGGRLPGRRS
jgi:tetratricopeptide (TPR) repeat protein